MKHGLSAAEGLDAIEVRKSGPWLVVALCLVLSPSLGRAVADESVRIWPRFQRGDRLTLELVKTREKRQPGRPAFKATSTTPVEIEVIENSTKGIALGWTMGKTETDYPRETLGPLAFFLDATAGVRLEIEIDERGVITGLRNAAEVEKKCRELVKKMFDGLRESGAPAETLNTARQLVDRFLATTEAIEQAVLREAYIYLMPIGWELQPDQPLESENALPNPLGGDPIPATARVSLVDYKPGGQQIRIKFRQQMDPEKAAESLASSLERATGSSEARKAFDSVKLDVTDESDFTIERDSGWITAVRSARIIQVDDRRQIDTTIFRLSSPKAPAPEARTATSQPEQPAP
jgi:hypothetical protein